MPDKAYGLQDRAPSGLVVEGIRVSARPFGTSPEVHDSDFIFRFIMQGTNERGAALQAYFESGAESAAWLKRMIAAYRCVDEPFSLLEFAAGYGRVSRHIPSTMPQAQLVASDIHPQAVNFLRQIGISSHQSSRSPEQFVIDQQFDVIFALSFFTHMPRATWTEWLRALLRRLAPDGCLIFTTHGVPGMRVMGEAHGRKLPWDGDGFWFEPMSEQADIDTAEYGSSGTSFRFVNAQIEACGARLFQYQERGAGYQDVYTVRAVAADDDSRDRTGAKISAAFSSETPPQT